ncbi:MAG: M23 family metallopeptidase [Chitinophagaceae bacterium]|nr:MAG: M23 family metallopeptidase [Chitinophagaceae bacterium]
MKKIKYFYNTHSLRYEKLETPFRVTLLRIFGFITAALVTAGIISFLAFRFVDSPNEKILRNENEKLKDGFLELNNKLEKLTLQMTDLEKTDNEVYRSIFEANPIPDSARAQAKEKEKQIAVVEAMGQTELISSLNNSLNSLSNRILAQNVSFSEIENLIKNKEQLLAATPAIQPISNKNLKRIASGFGYRIDPIYKTVKLHPGLDFTAPSGTPIYATANGTIEVAGNKGDGYGKHVIINHGYGYKTLYGHMYRVKARAGQKINRGEVIGWVGSSGKSTGPHCHYEVIKYGNKLDPIYFFYNDLSPGQFDQLLKKAAATNQSLD